MSFLGHIFGERISDLSQLRVGDIVRYEGGRYPRNVGKVVTGVGHIQAGAVTTPGVRINNLVTPRGTHSTDWIEQPELKHPDIYGRGKDCPVSIRRYGLFGNLRHKRAKFSYNG